MISLARQEIARVWWRCKASGYERVISQLVLSEAAAGDAKAARERLAERFVRPDCIPAKAKDDAMHLAFCAVHAVPYLLTWNFRHLANPDNRRRLRLLCESAGYEPPSICTPDEIMKGEL